MATQYLPHELGEMFKEQGPQSLTRTLSTDLPANYGFLTLDSRDREGSQSITNFNLSKKNSLFQLAGVEKMALEFMQFDAQGVPNVNVRNNTLNTQDNLGIQFYYIIPEGYYNDEAFVSALNVGFATFAGFNGGIPVATLTSDLDGRRIKISSPNGFVPNKNPAQKRDAWALIGMPNEYYAQIVNDTVTCSEIFYTTYIDIRSRALSQFDEILDESSNPTSADLVERIYLNNGIPVYPVPSGETSQGYYRPSTIAFKQDFPRWINWNNKSSNFGNVIDFQLTDQFGDELYVQSPRGCVEFSIIFYTRTLK